MSEPARRAKTNILVLKPGRRTLQQERAMQAAGQVRRQLSLLQGYADLMEGLSPEQNLKVLRVMAEKTRELTMALTPFLDQSEVKTAALADYRRVRTRTRQLLEDYRLLLGRLHTTVSDASGVSRPGA